MNTIPLGTPSPRLQRVLVVAGTLLLHWPTAGGIVSVTSGTAAPPDALGPYALTSLAQDFRPDGSSVLGIPAPVSVSFDRPMKLLSLGTGWSTWSHGFTGEVYATGTSELVLTPAPNTFAIGLAIEPDLVGTLQFSVGVDGTAITVDIDGDGGAQWVGFWSDDSTQPIGLLWIRDVAGTAAGFAVGEVGVYTRMTVPEPAAYTMLFGVGLVGLVGLVALRRHQNP